MLERVFNLSGSEIVFLLLAGLVVLGPERLPGVIRSVGRLYGEIRNMATGLEKELRDTIGDPVGDIRSTMSAPLHELRRTADSIRTGFGEVDDEPSPPMRPERSATPEELAVDEVPVVDGDHEQETDPR